jgi:uncharacterized surface protein with fasciclin (FAS1) repeats
MTSFQGGTNSGYASIASYRLNTQLFEDEYEYISGEPSVFTIQNTIEKKPLYGFVNGFQPNMKNDNISIMENTPECKPFLDFVKKHDLVEILRIQPDYTLFIPIGNVDILDEIVDEYGEIAIPQNLLKYHMIDRTILPIQIIDQIFRIKTLLRNQYITVKNSSVLTHHDEVNLLEDNKITKYIKTDNGSIYFINRPLVFDIYNYL